MIRRARSRSAASLPVLGLGTWRMGEDPRLRRQEVEALKTGLDLGLDLVDTAEMYGSGGAEEVVAEAVAGRRDEVFLVSKVLPENASRSGTIRAAEQSLRRLRTDRIDLYLLHWPGRHPVVETLEAFARLVAQGKVLHYGVSNFDLDDLAEAESHPAGASIASNQVLYNLERRGIERKLLPWCAAREVVVMAYSPIEQNRLTRHPALAAVARRVGEPPETVAIAWTLRLPGVVAIPKSSNPAHVRANARAAQLELAPEDLAELDHAYPVPATDGPLETL